MHGQALEGKDVKDLLLTVGSGGGAAPAAGGAATSGGAADASAEETAEEKEEGTDSTRDLGVHERSLTNRNREGRVRRGYGFRSFRLSFFLRLFLHHFASSGFHKTDQRSVPMHTSMLRRGRVIGCP